MRTGHGFAALMVVLVTRLAFGQGPTNREDPDAARRLAFQATVQQLRETLSAVTQNIPNMDAHQAAEVKGALDQASADLHHLGDPYGLHAAVANLNAVLAEVSYNLQAANPNELLSAEREVADIDARLSIRAGPDIAERRLRANEAQARQQLASIRSALAKYHSILHSYPETLDALVPNYLSVVPVLILPFHKPSQSVVELTGVELTAVRAKLADSGQWVYIGSGTLAGTVLIDCSHKTTAGIPFNEL